MGSKKSNFDFHGLELKHVGSKKRHFDSVFNGFGAEDRLQKGSLSCSSGFEEEGGLKEK